MESTNIITFSEASLADKIIYELESDCGIIKVLNYDGTWIKIVKIGLDLFLKAKDVLKLLEYSDNPFTIRSILSYVPSEYKIALKDILKSLPDDHSDLNETYLTENGFYRLVIRSNKPKALDFQLFVYNTLAYLRKNALTGTKTQSGPIENKDLIQVRNEELVAQNKLLLQKLEESKQKMDAASKLLDILGHVIKN